MLAFQQNLKLQMIKRLTYISLLFILGCTKGELPDSTYTGNGLELEEIYDLTVDTTRLGASAWVPGTYSHDPQANNHPGYGFNPPGWLNLEYNKTYVWGVGLGMNLYQVERMCFLLHYQPWEWYFMSGLMAVSYTHLTLPTILLV